MEPEELKIFKQTTTLKIKAALACKHVKVKNKNLIFINELVKHLFIFFKK